HLAAVNHQAAADGATLPHLPNPSLLPPPPPPARVTGDRHEDCNAQDADPPVP
ncbi:MAG: hypothetical protein QOH99_1701, partial [Frankiaceae bacterium]|nr:hypothetical protein [Frankiaceae bacterium]